MQKRRNRCENYRLDTQTGIKQLVWLQLIYRRGWVDHAWPFSCPYKIVPSSGLSNYQTYFLGFYTITVRNIDDQNITEMLLWPGSALMPLVELWGRWGRKKGRKEGRRLVMAERDGAGPMEKGWRIQEKKAWEGKGRNERDQECSPAWPLPHKILGPTLFLLDTHQTISVTFGYTLTFLYTILTVTLVNANLRR